MWSARHEAHYNRGVRARVCECVGVLRTEHEGAAPRAGPGQFVPLATRALGLPPKDGNEEERCPGKGSTLVDDRGPDTDATRVYAEVVEDRLFIRFNRFFDAERLIHSAIRQIDGSHLAKVKRIALDLRGNVGGSVDDLAGVLDRFFASRAGIEYLRIRAT